MTTIIACYIYTYLWNKEVACAENYQTYST